MDLKDLPEHQVKVLKEVEDPQHSEFHLAQSPLDLLSYDPEHVANVNCGLILTDK